MELENSNKNVEHKRSNKKSQEFFFIVCLGQVKSKMKQCFSVNAAREISNTFA